ncbi:MAG: hypothetical protein JSV32_00780, partial [Dehalococcoidia bacterium]
MTRILVPTIALVIVIGMLSCVNTPTTTLPDDCQPVTPLFSVSEAISNHSLSCWERLYELQGRVAKNSQMSASIWSLNTEAGTALIVSALHTLGEGWLGPGGTLIEERLSDPNEKPGATRIFLVKGEDGSVDNLASVLFILYNPEVPPDQSGNFLRDIHPRHDFFVGVIDSQKIVMEPFPGEPAPLRHEPPIIFDPSGLTTTSSTYADTNPGDTVVMMGYPQAGDFASTLAASIGRVLSDEEAEAAIGELAALGDEEGGIPYDPEVEMIIEGHAALGMSGGGAYDSVGRQVGIIVRASDEYNGKQFVRAVRMTFAVSSLLSAYKALSD